MSAFPAPALDAIAFQLAASLDDYEARVTAMVSGWPDLEAYAASSADVDRIRMYSAALPDLRVQWVEVLITHAELVHHLWRGSSGRAAGEDRRGPVLEQHLDAVRALRSRCERVLQRSRQGGADA